MTCKNSSTVFCSLSPSIQPTVAHFFRPNSLELRTVFYPFAKMATQTSTVVQYVNLGDARIRTFWMIQIAISLAFILYSVFLYHLPTIQWNGQVEAAEHPEASQDGLQTMHSSSKTLATDVWFALVWTTALDAATTVATFNRPIIDNWHYFVSVRMMALGSMLSFMVFLCGRRRFTCDWRLFSIAALCAVGAIHKLIGFVLNATHRSPPTTHVNARFWTIREYTIALSRFPGPWKGALSATIITGGLGTILTMLVPSTMSSMIPIMTTAFEVRVKEDACVENAIKHLTGCVSPDEQVWSNTSVHSVRSPYLPGWGLRALGLEADCYQSASPTTVLDFHLAALDRQDDT